MDAPALHSSNRPGGLLMRRIIPHSHSSLPAIAMIAVLAACSPSERQQANNDARQTTNTARNDVSKAPSGAARAVDDASVTARVNRARHSRK